MVEGGSDNSTIPTLGRPLRWTYLGIGWLSFGFGVLGAFLPVLPTTLFMIIALWAFARSSPKYRQWLYDHRRFGPALQNWHRHQVIPRRAKITALAAMTASLAYLVLFTATPWPYVLAAGLLMLVGAGYILSKPSDVPQGGGATEPATD